MYIYTYTYIRIYTETDTERHREIYYFIHSSRSASYKNVVHNIHRKHTLININKSNY